MHHFYGALLLKSFPPTCVLFSAKGTGKWALAIEECVCVHCACKFIYLFFWEFIFFLVWNAQHVHYGRLQCMRLSISSVIIYTIHALKLARHHLHFNSNITHFIHVLYCSLHPNDDARIQISDKVKQTKVNNSNSKLNRGREKTFCSIYQQQRWTKARGRRFIKTVCQNISTVRTYRQYKRIYENKKWINYICKFTKKRKVYKNEKRLLLHKKEIKKTIFGYEICFVYFQM